MCPLFSPWTTCARVSLLLCRDSEENGAGEKSTMAQVNYNAINPTGARKCHGIIISDTFDGSHRITSFSGDGPLPASTIITERRKTLNWPRDIWRGGSERWLCVTWVRGDQLKQNTNHETVMGVLAAHWGPENSSKNSGLCTCSPLFSPILIVFGFGSLEWLHYNFEFQSWPRVALFSS